MKRSGVFNKLSSFPFNRKRTINWYEIIPLRESSQSNPLHFGPSYYTQIIFNFHFIRYWSWFSVSFNFNFRLFSRMWYLYSVNKGRTLLKFIEYLKALRKIFANVSKFLHVNTKSNVKTRNENRQGNSTKERLFSVLMSPIPRGKMLYNWVSGEEFGESLVFSEGTLQIQESMIQW